ncbi:MAG: hypothetical protein RIS47_1719 [Bacteroidota bacterium]|jgi:probable phosphoglycerate mutase
MNPKHFYIVRHGETDFNLQGIIQGRLIDADLNQTGYDQADKFYEKYKHLSFDRIYSSSLKRTGQSVAKFIENGGIHEQLAGLDELSWGIYDGRFPSVELKPGIRRILRRWEEGKTQVKAFGGESPEDVATRLRQSLQQILNTEATNILISTHGRAIRILLCLMFGKPISQMTQYGHNNLCLYQVDYDPSSQKFKMVLENDTSHFNQ